MMRVLVCGAGGFIGHHLVARLKAEGCWVRGACVKEPEFAASAADEFHVVDLRDPAACRDACRSIDTVFQLAADMGGMGFIAEGGHARIYRNNALINIHMLEAARLHDATRYFFASSACIYPESKQTTTENAGLREFDAYPAAPQDAYGWEKLTAEKLAEYYRRQYGMQTRIARFHNIYGPLGSWHGGREKAPAAICRKVAVAKLVPELGRVVEVWGDGRATRSYCWIDDCITGILALTRSAYVAPLNIGSDESVSVDGLVQLAAHAAGITVEIKHVEGPEGVRGRNSNNEMCRRVLDWCPPTSIADGIRQLYPWVEGQVKSILARGADPRELARGHRYAPAPHSAAAAA